MQRIVIESGNRTHIFLEEPICHECCARCLLAVPAVAHAYRYTGSPVTSYLTARHKHDPVRVMGAVDSEEGGGPEEAMMCQNDESLGD